MVDVLSSILSSPYGHSSFSPIFTELSTPFAQNDKPVTHLAWMISSTTCFARKVIMTSQASTLKRQHRTARFFLFSDVYIGKKYLFSTYRRKIINMHCPLVTEKSTNPCVKLTCPCLGKPRHGPYEKKLYGTYMSKLYVKYRGHIIVKYMSHICILNVNEVKTYSNDMRNRHMLHICLLHICYIYVHICLIYVRKRIWTPILFISLVYNAYCDPHIIYKLSIQTKYWKPKNACILSINRQKFLTSANIF